jgi:hypothetical protein
MNVNPLETGRERPERRLRGRVIVYEGPRRTCGAPREGVGSRPRIRFRFHIHILFLPKDPKGWPLGTLIPPGGPYRGGPPPGAKRPYTRRLGLLRPKADHRAVRPFTRYAIHLSQPLPCLSHPHPVPLRVLSPLSARPRSPARLVSRYRLSLLCLLAVFAVPCRPVLSPLPRSRTSRLAVVRRPRQGAPQRSEAEGRPARP